MFRMPIEFIIDTAEELKMSISFLSLSLSQK